MKLEFKTNSSSRLDRRRPFTFAPQAKIVDLVGLPVPLSVGHPAADRPFWFLDNSLVVETA